MGFTMALRIELVLSKGQITKDVRVLNGLPKTHIFELAIVTRSERASASFCPVPEAQLDRVSDQYSDTTNIRTLVREEIAAQIIGYTTERKAEPTGSDSPKNGVRASIPTSVKAI